MSSPARLGGARSERGAIFLEAGEVGPTLTTLQKVASALDMKVSGELSTAG